MARPKTALGTSGTSSVVGQVQGDGGRWVAAPKGTKPGRYRARTKFRDRDGILRDVERYAATKARAEAKLRVALAERSAPSRSDLLRGDMTVVAAGRVWLAQVARADSDLSDNTRKQYADAFKRYVDTSSLAALTLREANRVQVLERYLQGVADENGTGAAKTARTVVSAILSLALRYEAVEANAMRDTRPAKASSVRESERDTDRALTRTERQHLLDTASEHAGTRASDASDVVWFLAGTGVRISEALGQEWSDIDLDAGTVHVRGTKTKHSNRTLSMPEWLITRLRERERTGEARELIFPSPGLADRTSLRDRRNVARVLRAVFDSAGFPWATPHTLRRTVATLLDQAGVPLPVIADQLGHADVAMTARVYLGRKGDMSAVASVL